MNQIDHSACQSFLNRYLTTTPDGRMLVRYRSVSPADRDGLRDYLETLGSVDPAALSRDYRFAFWINLYNWYAKDFAADRADLLRYLASVRDDLADRLLHDDGTIRYAYDWSLNRADSVASDRTARRDSADRGGGGRTDRRCAGERVKVPSPRGEERLGTFDPVAGSTPAWSLGERVATGRRHNYCIERANSSTTRINLSKTDN